MNDAAHDRIGTLIHDLAGCLENDRLPAVDVADLRVVFKDDGGRAVAGVGVASGEGRLEQALALALRDLSDQLRRMRDDEPGGTPG